MEIRTIDFLKNQVNYKDIRNEAISFLSVTHPANKKVYVMSDIHGDFDGFMEMLDNINFSDYDEMYILGDAIDRGPDGILCLQYIMSHKNIHMILGNHEMIFHDALFNPSFIPHWMERNGGAPTIHAFMALNKKDQADIVDFINSLPLSYIVTVGDETFTLCHASNPTWFEEYLSDGRIIDKYYNIADYAVWYRGNFEFVPDNNDTVIIGHTPTITLAKFSKNCNAKPIVFQGDGGNMIINIDCGNAYKSIDKRCKLCCLNLNYMETIFV